MTIKRAFRSSLQASHLADSLFHEFTSETASYVCLDPLGLRIGGYPWMQCAGIADFAAEENEILGRQQFDSA
ncbi:MAG: hypothetical protein ACI8UZ_001843 [Akkermansiaceae bacterium]